MPWPHDANVMAGVDGWFIGLREVYQPGYNFAKAGVMLLGVHASCEEQYELALEDDEPERDRARLMIALDSVNDRWGKGTLRIGSGRLRRAAR